MLSVVVGILMILSIGILVAHAMEFFSMFGLGLSHAHKNAPGRSQSDSEK